MSIYGMNNTKQFEKQSKVSFCVRENEYLCVSKMSFMVSEKSFIILAEMSFGSKRKKKPITVTIRKIISSIQSNIWHDAEPAMSVIKHLLR